MRAARLVHLTDTHLFGDIRADLRGCVTYQSLQRVLRAASTDVAACDALLVTGDLVQDDAGGYPHLRTLLAPFGKPVWILPGNHDAPHEWRTALQAAPFVPLGVHDVAGWRVVLLDTQLPGSVGGRIAAEELQRLATALDAASQRPTLVCLHHHPVPIGSAWLDTIGVENGTELMRMLDTRPQVRGLVWGHVHQAYDRMRGHVRLLATPSTCVQFLPQSADFAADTRPPAYRRLALLPDGTIVTEVVWVP
jgi:3',5'-cyclic-AMP phosphodiesterase